METQITLVTKPACPFAERVRIVLALLAIPHRVETVDVYDPPAWFRRISPLGKVPVLLDGEAALFESTAINEYLGERHGNGTALIPGDPLARAEMRAWIQVDETALVPAFYRLVLARDPAARTRLAAAYLERLEVLEQRLSASGGPFLMGHAPSLADITVFTHLWRLEIVGKALELESTGGPGVAALKRVVRALPRVDAATASWSEATADLKPYLAGTARGETRRDMTGQ
ncbi:MAG: glutathione S-transferase family protein [Pseudomonadota bacterium]